MPTSDNIPRPKTYRLEGMKFDIQSFPPNQVPYKVCLETPEQAQQFLDDMSRIFNTMYGWTIKISDDVPSMRCIFMLWRTVSINGQETMEAMQGEIPWYLLPKIKIDPLFDIRWS